jgi:hypothetical protein
MPVTDVRLLLVSLALVVLAVGCGDRPASDPSTSSVGTTASEQSVDLPTNGWSGGSANEALISGTLSVDGDDCVLLAGREGRRLYTTWPAGFSASRGAEGVRLFDADGSEVAVEGDTVEMSGGYGEVSEPHPCFPRVGLRSRWCSHR